MKPVRTVTPPIARFDRPRANPVLRELDGPGSGGPVGSMQTELNARLTAAEYERWLLPPEPRDDVERVVHILSLGAGVLALTMGTAFVWLLL